MLKSSEAPWVHSSNLIVEFHLLQPIQILYCALVCSILEYGNILWDASTAADMMIVCAE